MFRLYLAGEYLAYKDEIFNWGFNRLLSYGYQAKLVDKIIIKYLSLCEEKLEEEKMDLFLAGAERPNKGTLETLIEDENSNILFNYFDGKRVTDKYKQLFNYNKLFIDSGAFSAWTKGKEVNVDEYIKWINDRSDYIYLYGQVDKIPGDRLLGSTPSQVKEAADLTWQNYLYMEQRMNNPDGLLYTFHVGEPYEFLEKAMEYKNKKGKLIPYIALGGMVGKPMPVKRKFLDTCFKIIQKSSNPNVKVHAFGMTSFDILSNYPITSADSTSWIMCGANGNIMTDTGLITVSEKQSYLKTHYSHLDKLHQKDFENSIMEFGFTLNQLSKSRDARMVFNAKYMNKKASCLKQSKNIVKKSLF